MEPFLYTLWNRSDLPVTPEAWHHPAWQAIPGLNVSRPMGKIPVHLPETTVKAAWDKEAVYLSFRVRDQFVRATAQKDQDSVCQDSCVEFFFVPGEDISHGYFNLEINCCGTLLFHFQPRPRQDSTAVRGTEKILRATPLPPMITEEIQTPVTWYLTVKLPIELLLPYAPVTPPAPGVIWRANLYKCADASSHPHWLTWAPVNHPVPDFHRPQDFAHLVFQGIPG